MPQGEAKGSITADKSNAWEERRKRIGQALACGDMRRHKGAIFAFFRRAARPRRRMGDFRTDAQGIRQSVAQFLKLRDWLFAPLGLFNSWRAIEELKALQRQQQNSWSIPNAVLDRRGNHLSEISMGDRRDWAAIVTAPGQEFLACQEIGRFCLTCFLPQRRRRIFLKSAAEPLMYAMPLIPRRVLMPLGLARDRALHYARGVEGPKFLVDGADGRPWTSRTLRCANCPGSIARARLTIPCLTTLRGLRESSS